MTKRERYLVVAVAALTVLGVGNALVTGFLIRLNQPVAAKVFEPWDQSTADIRQHSETRMITEHLGSFRGCELTRFRSRGRWWMTTSCGGMIPEDIGGWHEEAVKGGSVLRIPRVD